MVCYRGVNLVMIESALVIADVFDVLDRDCADAHLPATCATPAHSPRGALSDLALWALEHYSARRRRERFLPKDLFRDPAWDVLLDLYIAEAENRSVRITSACRVASHSTSTGLRWIANLEARHLVERTPDLTDGRASFIRLSDQGWQQMTRFLEDSVATCHEYVRDQNGRLRVKKLVRDGRA